MKIILIVLSFLLLSGCGLDEAKWEKAKQDQTENYIDETKKNNNPSFKLYCTVYEPSVAEAFAESFIVESVTCPTDLKPFNGSWREIWKLVFSNFSICVYFFAISIMARMGFFGQIKAVAKGEAKFLGGLHIKLIILLLLTPIPFVGGSSAASLIAGWTYFGGIHFGNISINYDKTETQIPTNVTVSKPNDFFLIQDMTNIIAWYTDIKALNKNQGIEVNFAVKDNVLVANTIYKTSELEFKVGLNTIASSISEKYGLGYDQSYQVKELKRIISEIFADADFYAGKIVRSTPSIHSTENDDFDGISCEALRVYDITFASKNVRNKFAVKAAACLSAKFNGFVNSVGEAKTARLCDAPNTTSEDVKTCLISAYGTSLYAGSVATEYYNYAKEMENEKTIDILEFPLIFFKKGFPDLTTNAGIFYNSFEVNLYTDVQKDTYSNTYGPDAFSISVQNSTDMNIPGNRKREVFEPTEGQEGGLASSISFKQVIISALSGADGFCGQARNAYCSVRPNENTDRYNCNGEMSEKHTYGVAIAACGVALKSGGLFKRLKGGERSREVQSEASKAIATLPNLINGVKIVTPILAVVGAGAATNAWLTPESSYNQNEAIGLMLLSVISSKQIQEGLDSMANSLMALGFFIGYSEPLTIFLCLVSAGIYIHMRGLASMFSTPVALTKNLFDKERDETLDIPELIKELIIALVKPTLFFAGFVIANAAYQIGVYDVNTYSFTENMLITDDITIANIFFYFANEAIRLSLNIVMVVCTFGMLEKIVKSVEDMLVDDELNAKVTHDETAAHLKESTEHTKDLAKKKQ